VAEHSTTTLRDGALEQPRRPAVDLARILPSGRSILVGFVLLAGGILSYVVARQTSAFALRAVEVRGAPPSLEREVRTALGPLHGRSLLALDPQEIEERLAELPAVGAASYDRAFPHTLRIWVSPERPVAVLRSGAGAWLLSAHAKVLRRLGGPLPNLPRVWVGPAATPRVGFVPGDAGLTRAAQLVAKASRAEPRLAKRIATVRLDDGRLTFVLRSGTELRLGPPAHIQLKLAVAARLLGVLPSAERQRIGYIDLSVPTRPVAGS
jgi:cell division septal protein FtsQ